MEEDIKRLKAFLSVLNEENILYKKEDAIEGIIKLYENLIARYKEIKENNIELQKYMKDYLIPKSTINLVYIPKSKVKEKIEELEERNISYFDIVRYLKDLLEES